MYLGFTHLAAGNLQESDSAFQKSLALRPAFPPAISGLAQVAVLRDRFDRAQQTTQPLLAQSSQNLRDVGSVPHFLAAMYEGRTRAAAAILEKLIRGHGPGSESAAIRASLAEIHNAHGDSATAAREAAQATREAEGGLSIVEALFQGSVARSTQLRTEYQRLADVLPFGSDKVLPLLADAVVAVQQGQHQKALDLVKQVLPELPPGPVGAGSVFPLRQPRMIAEYVQGLAHLGLGNVDGARRHFETIVNAGYMRLYTPVEYVRSHYYLAQAAEKSGDSARARAHYERFLFYWKNGDIDRDKVAYAIKKTS
jgi:tetratricopeptide (TPR) repeat protein